ncbi:MAG: GNAT family N-acetyltransferase [Kiritimatiellae bacterium]|nr:GNAT family N-acetyltransferase [Kiritimatiellia bacterium]
MFTCLLSLRFMPNEYPILPDYLPKHPDLTSGHYVADFARTREELEEVQRLRFKVFNLELGEGLDESYETERDADPYDDQCHHLIIRHQQTGELVGTYRMQNRKMAMMGKGFYSDSEYVLDQLPPDILEQSLELGRACIASEHRSGRVLFLLWRGLLYYLQLNGLRYMFGCCSLASQDPVEGWALFTRLQRAGNVLPDFNLDARPDYVCEQMEFGEENIAGSEMPRLMRLYIDYGANICSQPALDRAFKTIDYIALFDLHDIPPKLMKVFKKDIA